MKSNLREAVLGEHRAHSRKLIFLESLRGFAALYVFAGHLVFDGSGRGGKRFFLFQFGQEAVIFFFILSGFVIFYSVEGKDQGYAEYFARRAARIYPLYLIALIVTSPYHSAAGPPLWSNIFMLQDYAQGKPGVWFSTYGSDDALWSLSYEWWFYMMFFPIQKFVAVKRQQDLVMAMSVVNLVIFAVRPNQISLFLIYFSIWWVGVELARSFLKGQMPTLPAFTKSLAALGIPILFFSGWTWHLVSAGAHLSLGYHPILEARHFAAALVILCMTCMVRGNILSAIKKVFRPFALLAPVSYSIYIFHLPLVVDATYLSKYLSHPVALLPYTAVLILFCYMTEIVLQPRINDLLLRRWRKDSSM